MKIDAKSVASISRVFCLIFAMSTILLGASVIYGWHAKLLFLIKYQNSIVSMGYNPALLFVCAGLSIILAVYNKNKLNIIPSIFVLLIGAGTFTQYLFPIELHIDEIFFKHWRTMNNGHPGRMAPNSALCFALIGLTLLIINSRKIKFKRMAAAITLAVLVLCLATLFYSGYYSDIQNAYMWTKLAPMAENTAFGFILISLSLIFFITYRSIQEKIALGECLPYTISICLLVTILLLTFAIMNVQENMGASKIAWYVLFFGSIFAIIVGLLTKALIKVFIAEKEVQGALSLVRATFEANVSGVVVISKAGKIVDNNRLFLKIWDIAPAQIIDCNVDELRDIMLSRVKDKHGFETLFRGFDKELLINDNEVELSNGNVILINSRLQILNNQPVGIIWTCQDITLRKNLEQELLRQATYDTLTSLPNKFLIIDMLARELEMAKVNKTKVAIIFIDLDGFSKINDLFGRSRGDFLLQAISERLRSVLLEGELIGRIAGDEFLIVIPDVKDNAEVLAVVYRLQGTFHNPFSLHGSNISVTMCAGITLSPKDGIDADTILSNADIAVLKAKQEGRNRFKFYHESMNVYSIRNLELENDLHAALEKDQFVVHYQPIINLANNKPYGVEALIRWNHPLQKIIPPLDFIPLAENLGLINKIGEWVLITACGQLEEWQQAGCDDLHLTVNVNVSANQFKLGFILHSVQEAINNSKVDPRYLNLELTEDVLFAGGEDMDEVLMQLRNMGVSISIDDFGIGYSSFAYLRKLKVNTLKIDKSFISHLGDNKEEEAIVSAIIAMGRNLQIKVLAEGVETPEQLEILRHHGCNLAQGFLFAKPMTAQECWAFLKRYID